ncbi:MAG: PfkB family carbohydrate kinase [Cyanobacteriota bacterium]|nr:PfkB family carbohydrate kinase [Cyanobacteriota bacterium]
MTAPNLPLVPLERLPPLPPLQLAVVGHVEMVSFLAVERLPEPGTIAHATGFAEEPAGGGAVVAAQLARLSGRPVAFFTALGRDAVGERAAERLAALGLELHVAWREASTRRAVSFCDASGERTITVIGDRLAPVAADRLPWERLASCDGIFATACDAAALRLSRRGRVLAATPRLRLAELRRAGVKLDALIGSGLDPGEAVPADALPLPPRLRLATEGPRGGWAEPGGRFAAPKLARPPIDAYGCGDSFAAGVTAGLAAGWSDAEAISLGCHCGAACATAPGPYSGQLRLAPGPNQEEEWAILDSNQ